MAGQPSPTLQRAMVVLHYLWYGGHLQAGHGSVGIDSILEIFKQPTKTTSPGWRTGGEEEKEKTA